MSRKGKRLYNAVTESFFGLLKIGSSVGGGFDSVDRLGEELAERIDCRNNRRIR